MIIGSSSAAVLSDRTAASGPGILASAPVCVGSIATRVTSTTPVTASPPAAIKAAGGNSTRKPSRSTTPPSAAGSSTGSPSVCSTTTRSKPASLVTPSKTAVDVVCPLADTRMTRRSFSASTGTTRSTSPPAPLADGTPRKSTRAPSITFPTSSTICTLMRAASCSSGRGPAVIVPPSLSSTSPVVGVDSPVVHSGGGTPVDDPSMIVVASPQAPVPYSHPSATSSLLFMHIDRLFIVPLPRARSPPSLFQQEAAQVRRRASPENPQIVGPRHFPTGK